MLNKTDTKKNPNQNKDEITEIFHYEHKKLITLALFNIALTIVLFLIGNYIAKNNILTSQTHLIFLFVVLTLTLSSLASSLFVALSPLNLAVVTKETIQIDHNQPLKWDDIELAEEFIANYFYRQPVIVLHLKPGIEYKLTFMQKICKNHRFTAFSIPLYAMSKEEADNIRKTIINNCRYEKNYK